jgi:hypothetical protein
MPFRTGLGLKVVVAAKRSARQLNRVTYVRRILPYLGPRVAGIVPSHNPVRKRMLYLRRVSLSTRQTGPLHCDLMPTLLDQLEASW